MLFSKETRAVFSTNKLDYISSVKELGSNLVESYMLNEERLTLYTQVQAMISSCIPDYVCFNSATDISRDIYALIIKTLLASSVPNAVTEFYSSLGALDTSDEKHRTDFRNWHNYTAPVLLHIFQQAQNAVTLKQAQIAHRALVDYVFDRSVISLVADESLRYTMDWNNAGVWHNHIQDNSLFYWYLDASYAKEREHYSISYETSGRKKLSLYLASNTIYQPIQRSYAEAFQDIIKFHHAYLNALFL